MNRSQLAEVLHAASRIVTDGDILVIGSQSILGTYSEDELPDAAVASIEVDIAFFDDPSYEKGDLVDAVLGEMSPFHENPGFYGQGVEITTAALPPGWQDRVIRMQTGGIPRPVSFLERHDLVISKLVAGREKDFALASALIGANLVDAETLTTRMLSMAETIEPAAHERLKRAVRSLNRPWPD